MKIGDKLELSTKAEIAESLEELGTILCVFEGSRRAFALLFNSEVPGCRLYLHRSFMEPKLISLDLPDLPLEAWPEPGDLIAWANNEGPHIQDLCPDMPPEIREALISGLTPAEWDSLYSEEIH